MRKIADTRIVISGCVRCIMYACEEGVYVFPCATEEDGSATGDYWFRSIDEAENFCRNEYGIGTNDWTSVPDPLPGCQDDWLAPVRVKGRDVGEPQWGKYERLENGIWVEFTPSGISQ